ncbi:VOC family protein [Modestobacter excelsi]|uniref:VOC family protein n=1 Tax=Modestobacter excelsi TaxID=2213161 RepID=UPI00110D090B|nr:VOC family protein [Modestobacter excelsi]
MGQPVAHFEIIGSDPQRLRGYYADLFGWIFDTSGEVSEAISKPDDYGFTDGNTMGDGPGIPGGVGGGDGYAHRAMFYVAVPDVEAALQKAERLGGSRQMGPVTSPTGLVIGHFSDPDGNWIGVAGIG